MSVINSWQWINLPVDTDWAMGRSLKASRSRRAFRDMKRERAAGRRGPLPARRRGTIAVQKKWNMRGKERERQNNAIGPSAQIWRVQLLEKQTHSPPLFLSRSLSAAVGYCVALSPLFLNAVEVRRKHPNAETTRRSGYFRWKRYGGKTNI